MGAEGLGVHGQRSGEPTEGLQAKWRTDRQQGLGVGACTGVRVVDSGASQGGAVSPACPCSVQGTPRLAPPGVPKALALAGRLGQLGALFWGHASVLGGPCGAALESQFPIWLAAGGPGAAEGGSHCPQDRTSTKVPLGADSARRRLSNAGVHGAQCCPADAAPPSQRQWGPWVSKPRLAF